MVSETFPIAILESTFILETDFAVVTAGENSREGAAVRVCLESHLLVYRANSLYVDRLSCYGRSFAKRREGLRNELRDRLSARYRYFAVTWSRILW
jgi:hypothetical protein